MGPSIVLTTAGGSEFLSGAIANTGTIWAASSGDVLMVQAGTLSNQGLLSIQGGDDFTVSSGAVLANAGTLLIGSGGTLALTGALSNTGTINAVGGTILVGGLATASEMTALSSAGGAVVVSGTLDNTGGTLALNAAHPLTLTGTIRNGVIQDAGGGLVMSGGTLDGVTYQGTLDVGPNASFSFQQDTIRDGLQLNGANGAGKGVLDVSGVLAFGNAETIVSGTIMLGTGTPGSFVFNPAALVTTGPTSVLTLGSGVMLEQTGVAAELSGSFVSRGTIDVGTADGNLLLAVGTLTNAGLLSVHNQGTFEAEGFLANTGTLNVAAGGTLELLGGFSNTGVVNATGGTIDVGGTVTTAELTALAGSGGTVVLTGILNNTGGTLALGTGTSIGTITLGVGAVIENGVIRAGNGLIAAGGTLAGVAYAGTIDVAGPLNIANGISAINGGTGVITVLPGADLSVLGNQTIDNMTVDLAGDLSSFGTLTLGLNSAVQVVNAAPTIVSSSEFIGGFFVNHGLINAGVAGGSLVVSNLANTGTLTVSNGGSVSILGLSNSGAVSVSSGGVLTIAGSLSNTGHISETNATLNLDGPLDLPTINSISATGGIVNLRGGLSLAGGRLNVGAGAALSQLRDLGIISGGTIHDGGSGMVFDGTLAADTYQGMINLIPALTTLTVSGGLTATGANGAGKGTIDLMGAGSELIFQNSQTFDNATINFGNNVKADTLSLADPTGMGAIVTLGTNATITQYGAKADIVIDRGLGDTLVNDGVITAAVAGGTMTVLGGTFTNNGLVTVASGETFGLQADDFGNFLNGTLSGGSWSVAAGSTLDLGFDSPVTSLNDSLLLNGAGSQVQYFDSTLLAEVTLEQTLRAIGTAGQLTIATARAYADTGAMTDNGHLTLANGSFSATSVAIGTGGVLAGAGTVSASAIADAGTILAQGGQLVVNGAIQNLGTSGLTEIGTGATLTANGVLGTSVQFLGSSGELVLSQAKQMSGTIAGFGGSDVIDLTNVGPAALALSYTSSGASGGVLTVKSGSATAAALHFAGAFTAGNFKASSDGHGGTLIQDPPVLSQHAMTVADLQPASAIGKIPASLHTTSIAAGVLTTTANTGALLAAVHQVP